jgi:hypothetical protein
VAKTFHVNAPSKKFYWDSEGGGALESPSPALLKLFPAEGPVAEASQECQAKVVERIIPTEVSNPFPANSPEGENYAFVVSYLRDAATLQEVHFADIETYKSCGDKECLALTADIATAKPLPDDVRMGIIGTEMDFVGWAWHKQFPNNVVYWDNQAGGLLQQPNERIQKVLAEMDAAAASPAQENPSPETNPVRKSPAGTSRVTGGIEAAIE